MAYKNVNVDISITPISSYNDLNNKPSINGVELDGNLSSEELDIKVDTTDIENNISTIKNDLDELGDQVSSIESKIPDESSDTNQLVDKLYVNNNFYTKNQVDQSINQKVNTSELDNYATKQQLEFKQDKLTAGENITISEEGVISATISSSDSPVEIPENVYTADNLIAGKNVTFTEVLPEGGIDEHTLACWHFDTDNIDIVNGISLGSSIETSFFKFAPGCSRGNGYQSFINLPFSFSSTQDFSFDLWYLRYASNGDGEIGFKDGKGFYNTMWFYINHNGEVQCRHNDTMSDVVATIPQGKWSHLYAHHKVETNTYEYFIDGKKVYSAVDETLFGDRNQFSVASYYTAYKDEVRISDCIRWDEDFTPPAEPYTLATGPSRTAVNASVAVPTKTSELENDSGYLTGLPTNLVNTNEEQTITSLKHFQGGIDLPINSEFMVANGTTVFKHNGSRLLMGATTDPLTIQSWTNPKINRNGTEYENIDSGNISEYVSTGSSSYELPIATTTTLGGVKVDGTTITITQDGVISSTVSSNGEGISGGPATWGNITGDISSQSDLQEELDKKVNGVGITSVIRLTQDEYDSLQSIDENAQYIIVGETSTQGGEYISTSSVVTSLDENVTDDQIPSAKLVYDLFMSVEQQLSEI
jgi:hypothetical protein